MSVRERTWRRRLRRRLQLANAAVVDLAVCTFVFRVRAPFLGDRGEYLAFLVFLPWAFIVLWTVGRISTTLITRQRPEKALGYTLACGAAVLSIAAWSILGATGWNAQGIGCFPRWQGLLSVADIFGLFMEPGWKPTWPQRIFDAELFSEIGVLAGLFLLATSMTRRAQRAAE